jgi:signal transduction histidine kinase
MSEKSTSPHSGKAQILVVEDNLVNRRVLEAKLGAAGYTTRSIDTGPKALRILEGEDGPSIDLVLLDVMMPGMDGIEVLRQIRSSRAAMDLPVILTTSLDKTDDVVRGLEAGANDYVTKPIDLPVLLSRLATHLHLKRVHEDLRDSHRSLVQAARMESVALLAAGVAHEIRNPLAQIQMGLEAVRSLARGGEPQGIEEILDVIAGSVGRAESIVRGLLASSANQKLQTTPGDLNAFVVETWRMVEDELARPEWAGALHLAADLPKIAFAPAELRQVLLNVLLNAMQAMEGRRGKITVSTRLKTVNGVPSAEGTRGAIHLRNGGKAAVIEVLDDGPGASPEVLGRMFDPFYTTRAAGSGTGLGLTVARKLMELHGGTIRIENRTDALDGLRVELLIPVSRTAPGLL